MSSSLQPPDILRRIEADADVKVGRAFVQIAADYFSQTRARDGRVSTSHTPQGLAERFDEELPREGQSIDEIIARLRSDVIPDSNHLFHPRYVGHQIAG